MSGPTLTRWLTPPDVAEQLGVEPPKVIAWINAGELVAVNVAQSLHGKRPRWRIDPRELEAFLLRRQKRPNAPRAKRRKLVGVTEYF